MDTKVIDKLLDLAVKGEKDLVKELLPLAMSGNPVSNYSATTENKGTQIVVLQRGWVMVGRLERTGSECKLYDASVIRVWGTTKGLGEIAQSGPKPETKLDPCNGVVEFDYLTVVATISCDDKSWKNAL